MAGPKIKIGMGQLLVEGGEPDRNLERAEEMIDEGASRSCDLVLLPECLDLAWTHPSSKDEALPIPGKYSDQLCKKAQEKKIWVCAGLTENDNGAVYNSAVLINRAGEIVLKYRKINVLDVGQEFYQIGQTLNVVDTEFGKIGVNICSDNYIDGLPIGHTLARMGAQIILSPSSWTVWFSKTEKEDPYGEKWIKPYSVLASLYGISVVGTTSVGVIVGGPYEGRKMTGCSLAFGPQGLIAQGKYNEFAGELIEAEFEVPQRKEKGTDIGKSLLNKGYSFDELPKDLGFELPELNVGGSK